MFYRIRQSQYARNVGTLATGTLIAQAIGIAASPILTRLYSPESFATLALFMAIVSSLAPGVSGRYEIAIVVAKNPRDSQSLFVLSTWVASMVCLIMMLVLLGGFSEIQSFLNADSLGTWLLLTPTALFLTAVVTILRYYANRKKGYKILSRLSIAQALVGITFTISLGWYGWQAKGLITANLLTLTFGSAYLLYFYRIDLRATDWFWSRNHWSLAQHYKDFPLYNASTSFLDGITSVLPVFFLTKYFPEAVVGYYALLTRVATGPLSFISQAVTQVHLQRVAELVHQGGKELPTYIYKLTLLLSFIVLIPTVIIMTYAPELFIFLFGSTWRTAGEILVILMPAFGLRFVVSTISGVFSVTGHIKLAAYWKILAFLAMMGALLIVSPYATINVFFVTLLLLDFFLYLILFIAIIYAVNKIRPNFLH